MRFHDDSELTVNGADGHRRGWSLPARRHRRSGGDRRVQRIKGDASDRAFIE